MSARILVVDDTLPNVKLMEAKLTKEYYTVITAVNGNEAILKAKTQQPDIILLDVMMPGMDGFETCKILRADPETSHIPVVMLTALSEKEDRVKGLEVGADDFLTKPANDIALFARVRSLVRLKVMIDELRMRGNTGMQFGINKESGIDDLKNSKILIIDDDRIQSRQLSDKLAGVTKQITVEDNPETALELASFSEYDLIIVSTQMVEADGLRICAQLRSIEKSRNVSIIILVDENDTNALVKGLEIGVSDYVLAPVDVNELIARVKTQVRRKRYQDALRTNYKNSLSMAITDGMTGLYNRRYMDGYLENMLREANENKKSLSFMIIDVDHFKKVNDTHGHLAGDEVLKQVASRVLEGVRPSDLAARYGGEEFVVVLSGTTLPDASVVAERIRTSIESREFPISSAGINLKVTASIGLSVIEHGVETPESLIKRADEALYEAKTSGRNRVVTREYKAKAV